MYETRMSYTVVIAGQENNFTVITINRPMKCSDCERGDFIACLLRHISCSFQWLTNLMRGRKGLDLHNYGGQGRLIFTRLSSLAVIRKDASAREGRHLPFHRNAI